MSADNGVYILITQDNGEMKYRVAHAGAVEDISHEPDHPEGHPNGLNTKHAHLLFGKSEVFTDLDAATEHAESIEDELTKDGDIVEYGVLILDHSDISFPPMSENTEATPASTEATA